MSRYRIVELIHNIAELKRENGRSSIEWIIETKGFWGWKEVMRQEVEPHRISHKTYSDAEAYMIANYMGHGMCKRVNNEYFYTPYTYYV